MVCHESSEEGEVTSSWDLGRKEENLNLTFKTGSDMNIHKEANIFLAEKALEKTWNPQSMGYRGEM